VLDKSSHANQVKSRSDISDFTCSRESSNRDSNSECGLLDGSLGVETLKFIFEQFFWVIYLDECAFIFFLIVEGREWFERTLVIAICMGTLKVIGSSDGFSNFDLVIDKSVFGQLLKQERLQLDENCLDCVGRSPALIKFFLVSV